MTKKIIAAAIAGFAFAAIMFGIQAPTTAQCYSCGAEHPMEEMVQMSGDNQIVFYCDDCMNHLHG